MDGKATVIRLNVMSQIGQQAAAQFGIRAVPTTILLDGDGQVLLTQVGIPKPGEVQTQVNQLILTQER